MNILLLAYAVSPTKGSEFSVGWNILINLAKNNKVHVLVGLSGDHMGDTREVEEYFAKYPNPNVELHVVYPNLLARIINYPNVIGIFGPIFYFAFPFWQKSALRIAKKIVLENSIDVIHHLNPIGFREPGYLWKIDKPFVWGPIGGALFVRGSLIENLPVFNRPFYHIKNLINLVQLKYNKRIKLALKKSSHIIFCNSENKMNFEEFFGVTGTVLPEQGTFAILPNPDFSFDNKDKCINLIWCGDVSNRKNIYLLLRALHKLGRHDRWHLKIVGEGNALPNVKRLADRLKLNGNIEWLGRKSRNEVFELMKRSDLHCMSSLAEGNPAVLFEAISMYLPTISLNKDGMADLLKGGNGFLVNVCDFEGTILAYALMLERIVDNPDLLRDVRARLVGLSGELTWSKKIQTIENIYCSIV